MLTHKLVRTEYSTVLLIKLAKRKALSVVKAVSYKAHYWICVQAV